MADDITPQNPEDAQAPNPDVAASSEVTPGTMGTNPDPTYPSVPEYASNNPAPKKSKKGLIVLLSIIGIFGIAVLCGIAVFAFNAFSKPTGGADSPSGVIKNFANAAQDHDLPGMLSSIDPNEIEPGIENIDLFTSMAEDEGDINDKDNPLDAYTYKFEDVETKTVQYSDDVARVELLSGKIKLEVDKSKLPKEARKSAKNDVTNIESANKDYIDALKTVADYTEADFNKNDLESKHIFYIAVKRDGKWYASALYSMAEYGRIYANAIGSDIDRPSFNAKDRVAKGASSSNGAVENFLSGIVGLDTENIIDATAPDRFSVGHDYKQTLLDLQKNNSENPYLKIAEDAIKISNLETTSKANGKNREFNKIENVKIKIKYNIDVKDGEESYFVYYPYGADIDAGWDGKCFTYSGEARTYLEEYPETDDFYGQDYSPFVDANGDTYEDSYDLYKAEFPIKDSEGRIYPTEDALYMSQFHPLPWSDADGRTVYDVNGEAVALANGRFEADLQESYPWADANGKEVYDEDGYESYDAGDPTYTKDRVNLDDKECFSNKELKSMPDFGLVTIKEDGKYYVRPIDTIWYYIIWGVKNSN